jgi:hypothetical protein
LSYERLRFQLRQPDTSRTEQVGSDGSTYDILGSLWVRIAAETPAILTDATRGFLQLLNEKVAMYPNLNTSA